MSRTHLSVHVTSILQGERPLGSYVFGEQIAKGGMSWVFRAHDTKLEKQVAVKVLFPHLLDEERTRERFLLEGQIQSDLVHPHIVRVYEVLQESEILAIAMEWVDGLDLQRFIQERNKPLSSEELWDVFLPVLDALAYAHQQGLVHRDIKAPNILLRSIGASLHPLISDFGIAKLRSSVGHTRTDAVMGTAAYMSPEQIYSSKYVDQRSDIYSLGVMLFFAATGRLPFVEENNLQLLYSHLEKEPPSISAFNADLPAALDQVVKRCLAKRPQDRFEHCAAVASAFTEALGDGRHPREVIVARATVTNETAAWEVEEDGASAELEELYTLQRKLEHARKRAKDEADSLGESAPSSLEAQDELPSSRPPSHSFKEDQPKEEDFSLAGDGGGRFLGGLLAAGGILLALVWMLWMPTQEVRVVEDDLVQLEKSCAGWANEGHASFAKPAPLRVMWVRHRIPPKKRHLWLWNNRLREIEAKQEKPLLRELRLVDARVQKSELFFDNVFSEKVATKARLIGRLCRVDLVLMFGLIHQQGKKEIEGAGLHLVYTGKPLRFPMPRTKASEEVPWVVVERLPFAKMPLSEEQAFSKKAGLVRLLAGLANYEQARWAEKQPLVRMAFLKAAARALQEGEASASTPLGLSDFLRASFLEKMGKVRGKKKRGVGAGASNMRTKEVFVEAGEFWWEDEKGEKKTSLPPFWMDRHEVSRAEYALCVTSGLCRAVSFVKDDAWDLPQDRVSVSDAKKYCASLKKKLPTAQQWVKAARGGLFLRGRTNPHPKRKYAWGNKMPSCKYANLNWCYVEKKRNVERPRLLSVSKCLRDISPYGVRQMMGNVAELTRGGKVYGGSAYGKARPLVLYNPMDQRRGLTGVGFRCVKEEQTKNK